jgi:hypothetical protein
MHHAEALKHLRQFERAESACSPSLARRAMHADGAVGLLLGDARTR